MKYVAESYWKRTLHVGVAPLNRGNSMGHISRVCRLHVEAINSTLLLQFIITVHSLLHAFIFLAHFYHLLPCKVNAPPNIDHIAELSNTYPIHNNDWYYMKDDISWWWNLYDFFFCSLFLSHCKTSGDGGAPPSSPTGAPQGAHITLTLERTLHGQA